MGPLEAAVAGAPGLSLVDDADRLWFRAHDLAGALALLDTAPRDTAALNFAGWLRTTERTGDAAEFERGVAQLKGALALGADDHRPAVNLAEALGLHGRAAEALVAVRPWCEAHPHAQAAWTSLGWLLGVVLDDDAGALAALQRAGWYPDAQLNLGRLHLKAKRHDEAEAAFANALKSFRPHEAWTRLGEFAASRGHLRRALGAFRRAAEVDRRGEYSLPLHQAVTTLGNALLQQGRYFLHAHEDSLLSQAREGAKEPATPRALELLQADAVAVRGLVREDVRDACDAIERCAASGSLLSEYADRSPAQRLERAGRADATALATSWRAAQLSLYCELLEREEPDHRVVGDATRVRSAMAARDWDAAFAALAGIDRAADGGVELAAELAEALADRLRLFGDEARAVRALRLAEDGWAEFASWATAGGEGLARMVAVNRVREKQRLG